MNYKDKTNKLLTFFSFKNTSMTCVVASKESFCLRSFSSSLANIKTKPFYVNNLILTKRVLASTSSSLWVWAVSLGRPLAISLLQRRVILRCQSFVLLNSTSLRWMQKFRIQTCTRNLLILAIVTLGLSLKAIVLYKA